MAESACTCGCTDVLIYATGDDWDTQVGGSGTWVAREFAQEKGTEPTEGKPASSKTGGFPAPGVVSP